MAYRQVMPMLIYSLREKEGFGPPSACTPQLEVSTSVSSGMEDALGVDRS